MGSEAFPFELGRSLRDAATVDVNEAVTRDGLPVVVKRLNPARAPGDPTGVLRFRREVTLATSLRQPGLPAVLDHGNDWIAFERLEGSLAVDARRRLYSRPRDVRDLLSRLAETLAYVHARGAVHRDIKPAHVMFRQDQPVLIDFSVAGLVSGDALGPEIVGSPAWMAPEQATGAVAHPRADVWSLCALGVWLMGGRAPPAGDADALLEARKLGIWPVFDFSAFDAEDPDLARLLKAGLGPAEERPDSSQLQMLLQLRRYRAAPPDEAS